MVVISLDQFFVDKLDKSKRTALFTKVGVCGICGRRHTKESAWNRCVKKAMKIFRENRDVEILPRGDPISYVGDFLPRVELRKLLIIIEDPKTIAPALFKKTELPLLAKEFDAFITSLGEKMTRFMWKRLQEIYSVGGMPLPDYSEVKDDEKKMLRSLIRSLMKGNADLIMEVASSGGIYPVGAVKSIIVRIPGNGSVQRVKASFERTPKKEIVLSARSLALRIAELAGLPKKCYHEPCKSEKGLYTIDWDIWDLDRKNGVIRLIRETIDFSPRRVRGRIQHIFEIDANTFKVIRVYKHEKKKGNEQTLTA